MILALATGPLAQAVGWALLHLVWQAAAVAAVLAMLLTLLPSRTAAVRYALSCAALALVVSLAVATGIRSYPRPGTPAPTLARSWSAPPDPGPAAGTPPVASIVLATFTPARLGRIPDPVRAATGALPAIVSLWLLGVTLLSLRLLLQWRNARRLVTHGAQPACEPWLAMARRLGDALGVRHAVRLLESTAVQVPAVIGLFRPVILLPANSLAGLMPGQLEMILAHELAHIRRHDFLVNLLQAAVETLLFYHPAVWWISRQVRIERENCCDDLAVSVCGNPLQYARALTRLEELRAERLPLVLSAGGGSLLDRIRRMVNAPATTRGPVRGVVGLALLAAVLLAIASPSITALAKTPPAAGAKPGHATTTTTTFTSTSQSETKHTSTNSKSSQWRSELPPPGSPAVKDADEGPDDNADATSDESAPRDRTKLTVDELIELRSQDVTPEKILQMRFVFPRIALRDIAGMYAVGATPEYVQQMRAAGIDIRRARDAQGLAAVGVTPEYVADMRRLGLEVESASQWQSLRAVGVTAEFVRDARASGLNIETADEAQSMAAVGVTPEFVRGIREAGLSVDTPKDAVSLAAVGVTPDFVRQMREAGVPIRDANDAQQLCALGVSPKFVRQLAKAGYPNLSISQLCQLAAGGMSGNFIEEMSKYRTH